MEKVQKFSVGDKVYRIIGSLIFKEEVIDVRHCESGFEYSFGYEDFIKEEKLHHTYKEAFLVALNATTAAYVNTVNNMNTSYFNDMLWSAQKGAQV